MWLHPLLFDDFELHECHVIQERRWQKLMDLVSARDAEIAEPKKLLVQGSSGLASTEASPEIPADAPPGGKAPRDIPADAPPGNAAAAKGTAGSPATPAPIPAPSHPAEGDGEGSPVILHIATMTRAEKEKVRRLVTPKPTTGNLSVPKDIFELWQTDKGREKLLCMWCKSGGVKAGLGGLLFDLLIQLSFVEHCFARVMHYFFFACMC